MSSNDYTEPGWYHAAGDPVGSTRYWDGELWQGEPVLPEYTEQSVATLALVLAVCSPFFILLAPVSWVISRTEIAAIDAGRRDPSKRGMAVVARAISAVFTILMAMFFVALTLAIVFL